MYCTLVGRGLGPSTLSLVQLPHSPAAWAEHCVTDLLYQAALGFPGSRIFVCVLVVINKCQFVLASKTKMKWEVRLLCSKLHSFQKPEKLKFTLVASTQIVAGLVLARIHGGSFRAKLS